MHLFLSYRTWQLLWSFEQLTSIARRRRFFHNILLDIQVPRYCKHPHNLIGSSHDTYICYCILFSDIGFYALVAEDVFTTAADLMGIINRPRADMTYVLIGELIAVWFFSAMLQIINPNFNSCWALAIDQKDQQKYARACKAGSEPCIEVWISRRVSTSNMAYM